MARWGSLGNRGKVEDRRGFGPVAVGGVSLAGIAALMIFNVLVGGDPLDVLMHLESIPVQEQQINRSEFEGQDSYEVFASTVLGSNNAMWRQIFRENGITYSEPILVLFRTSTDSACGVATSEVGPHYCPLDETIYLDETFFDELTSRFGARGGDVAEAYVISHEVAHHVQNKLGIMDEVLNQRGSDNQSSINLELQADCFAGLWVNSIKNQNVLEPGEIHEAMDAATSVGDDRIQKSVTGTVNPETWIHGSSEQRVFWFDRGYNEGNLDACQVS